MEKIIKANPKIKFINATEGGARIFGTDEMTLKEVIKRYGGSHVEKFEELKPEKNFKNNVIDELEKTIDILKEIRSKCKKADEYVNILKKPKQPLPSVILYLYLIILMNETRIVSC